MHMVVGADAAPLLGHGGISGYVGPLVRALLRADPETQYHLVLRQGWRGQQATDALDGLAPVTRVRLPDRVLTFWWECLGWTLPGQRKLWRSLDLYLATCLVAPVLPRGQVIAIVYDLIPLKLRTCLCTTGGSSASWNGCCTAQPPWWRFPNAPSRIWWKCWV